MSQEQWQPPSPVEVKLNRTMIGLLGLLTVVFLAEAFVPPFRRFAYEYLALNPPDFLAKRRLWQAVTAMFLQGGVGWYLMMMALLWSFGTALSNAWRPGPFLLYYLACGAVASFCFYGASLLLGSPRPGLSAVGGLFGLMAAYGMMFGDRQVLLFFLIPMKARTAVLVCFFALLLLMMAGCGGNPAAFGYVGGALFGYLWLKLVWWWQKRAGGHGRRPGGPGGSRIGGLEVMDHDRR
jgi:membrane associated rhomboid family serine protease